MENRWDNTNRQKPLSFIAVPQLRLGDDTGFVNKSHSKAMLKIVIIIMIK